MNTAIRKIPISWLSTQDYCEYQLYLEHVKGIKVAPTAAMKKGKEAHTKLEDEHKKKATLKLKTEEALKKAQRDKVVLVAREIRVNGNLLYGLIDEIHFTPQQIIIIDDKPSFHPFLGNKKQVWGYCMAFQEHFKPNLPIISCLRQRDTKKVIWEEGFSQEHVKTVSDCIDRIFGVLNGTLEATSSEKISKCNACKLNQICDLKCC